MQGKIGFVVDTLFAHTQYRFRNIVMTTLLDKLWTKEPRLAKDLKDKLREMTNTLVRSENSTVALKARTILIASEKPPYEVRHNHIERMFLDATNRYQFLLSVPGPHEVQGQNTNPEYQLKP